MNLTEIMEEIGDRLDTIVQLNVFRYSANNPPAPAAVVGLPTTYEYDQTYGRGSDALTLPVTVIVGRASDHASHKAIAAYANGSGDRSVKQVLDSTRANPYTSCDTVTVKSVEFVYIEPAGTSYLAAEFAVEITGSGS